MHHESRDISSVTQGEREGTEVSNSRLHSGWLGYMTCSMETEYENNLVNYVFYQCRHFRNNTLRLSLHLCPMHVEGPGAVALHSNVCIVPPTMVEICVGHKLNCDLNKL